MRVDPIIPCDIPANTTVSTDGSNGPRYISARSFQSLTSKEAKRLKEKQAAKSKQNQKKHICKSFGMFHLTKSYGEGNSISMEGGGLRCLARSVQPQSSKD